MNFDTSSTTITVSAMVTPANYEEVCRQYNVDGHPFWVNVSSWQDGQTVTIFGTNYVLSHSRGMWRAYYEHDDFNYRALYYHDSMGILLESTIRYSASSSIWSGSRTDIDVENSNLDAFISRVTGTNILINLLLITGIYIEIPVIAIVHKERSAKKAKKELQKPSVI